MKGISAKLGQPMSSIMRRMKEKSFTFKSDSYTRIFSASFFERLELPVKREQLKQNGTAMNNQQEETTVHFLDDIYKNSKNSIYSAFIWDTNCWNNIPYRSY